MMNGKRAVMVAAGVLAILAGLGAGGCAREAKAPPAKAQEQAEVNEEKDLALAFYKAKFLQQDYGAAYDMLHPSKVPVERRPASNWQDTPLTREEYIEQKSWGLGSKSWPVPEGLEIQEWRRPMEHRYTYLFWAPDVRSYVIVVWEDPDTGALTIGESYDYEFGMVLP